MELSAIFARSNVYISNHIESYRIEDQMFVMSIFFVIMYMTYASCTRKAHDLRTGKTL